MDLGSEIMAWFFFFSTREEPQRQGKNHKNQNSQSCSSFQSLGKNLGTRA